MPHLDEFEKKHLYSPGKAGQHAGKFMPEFDPIFTSDSWYQRASNATACTLGQVATGRTLFAYGFIVSKQSATAVEVRIREGGTVKTRIFIARHAGTVHIGQVETIGYGNPRAPVCRFNALSNVLLVSAPAAATVAVTMSWWDAEIV